ncbi:conserved protein of unknown function [Candidatus Hydrogenisulfobacillus filiaventi]|uniref:Uncharacterized protein n=1 Tax=Candidatus Hydrogenisulfobacillus filiaventi TaxID=2707344 RepID=A0A6F8ZFX5_9FIRM|nr:YlzJ-like family protein [Bacillota bacterium]CAB1128889.1 conserved protein of unknown function [Candidatus Hydrogenisulfobacillus filiaventi]
MLYTLVDPALLWGPDPTPPLRSVRVDGRLCLVRRDPAGGWRLERLLSTDPADYLDGRWTPNRLLGWDADPAGPV